jgi:stage II sporulation protein P
MIRRNPKGTLYKRGEVFMRIVSRYRTGIIDGKKAVMLGAVIFAVTAAALFCEKAPKSIDTAWLKLFFCQAVPMSQGYLKPEIDFGVSPSKLFFGFDVNDPLTIISNQIAVVSAASRAVDPEAEREQTAPEPKPSAVPAVLPPNAKKIEEITVSANGGKGYISSDGVFVKNNTTYDINVEKLINETLKLDIEKGAPQVLIVHTHTSEAFTPTDKNYYVPTDPDRTEDKNFNITRVGKEMADVLNGMGIETLHDDTVHDYPSYNGSYQNCLETVRRNLREHPSIKIVLDVHRDGMMTSDGTKLKVCTTIDGQKAAQVMLVCGTDNNGLDHPNWRENFKLALKIQAKTNALYPTLTRPVSLVRERYNMNTTSGSLLLEVGSNGNTLEEAINGGRYAARAIGELLKTL